MQMTLAFHALRNSRKFETKGSNVALISNVLLGMHNDYYFAIILTPDGIGTTNEQIEIYYADEAKLCENYVTMCAIKTEIWKTVFSTNIFVVEGTQLGRGELGCECEKLSAATDESTPHYYKYMAKELFIREMKPQAS